MAKWDKYKSIIEKKAKLHRVDPNLVRAIITVESNWDSEVIGDNGRAIGLMQIWLKTARWVSGIRDLTVPILLKPKANINLGTKYLSKQIKRFGVEGGVAAYNAGKVIKKKGDYVNRGYVNKVNKAYKGFTGKYLYPYTGLDLAWYHYVSILLLGGLFYTSGGKKRRR